jgi:hypothetical protein
MNNLGRYIEKGEVVVIDCDTLEDGYDKVSERCFVVKKGGGMTPDMRDERLKGYWLDDEFRRSTLTFGGDISQSETEALQSDLGKTPSIEEVEDWERE